MLARLTLGFFLLACGAVVAACSSTTTTPTSGGIPGIGPNFTTNTIYIANTTGQAIEIFTPSPGPSATPSYTIGGSNTTMNGPQYLAFDAQKHLYVTNYNAAQNSSSILVFAQYATGNVIPAGGYQLGASVQPRGVAVMPTPGSFVVAATNPGAFYLNHVFVYAGGAFDQDIAGGNTQLNNPVGIAVDAGSNIYVANNGTPSITIYALPAPSPTPTGSPTPTPPPTPTPSPTPTGATPSPSPTPGATNIAPKTTITSASLVSPMGITLDAAGNLYVADNGQPTARILVFNSPFAPGTLALTPARTITSAQLVNPVDVAVDSGGSLYVVDRGLGANPVSELLVFAPAANGNVTPTAVVSLPGTDTGIALSP
jgi:hypothetical protein